MASQSNDSCLSPTRRSWLVVTLVVMALLTGVVWYQGSLFRAKQLEAEARVLLLHDLMASSPRPILVVNAEGVITDVNPQALADLGYMRNELVGQPINDLIPKGCRHLHAAGFLEAVKQIQSDRKLWTARHTKILVVGKDGQEQSREMTAYAVPKQDGSLEFDLLFDGRPAGAENH